MAFSWLTFLLHLGSVSVLLSMSNKKFKTTIVCNSAKHRRNIEPSQYEWCSGFGKLSI